MGIGTRIGTRRKVWRLQCGSKPADASRVGSTPVNSIWELVAFGKSVPEAPARGVIRLTASPALERAGVVHIGIKVSVLTGCDVEHTVIVMEY
jgi:hypothetical protein